jgi:FSR family fosmidomycin resistance protein-like MFS transporter
MRSASGDYDAGTRKLIYIHARSTGGSELAWTSNRPFTDRLALILDDASAGRTNGQQQHEDSTLLKGGQLSAVEYMELGTRVDVSLQGTKVVGLVSAGHFFSHVYMLLLPPLFPVLREVYGVGFTELGFTIAVFSIATGLTQAPMGFLVDRYGARSILIGGLMLESVTFGLIGLFPYYGALLALMAVAGLANAVYHPADYAILNASVSKDRMGRAFSVHTFAGYLGTAVAPVTVLFLADLTSWRTAIVICAVTGGIVGIAVARNSDILSDATDMRRRQSVSTQRPVRSGLDLLFTAPILMGLLFFAGLSVASHGMSDFGVSTLHLMYDAPLTETAAVLSAYLFLSPAGVLIGGWIADRTARHVLITVLCLLLIGAAVFVIAAVKLPLQSIAIVLAVAGLFNGIVAPSRDMLIRAVTPPSEMGKVFGFVSTGYNIGGIVAPVMFGYLLDNAQANLLFWIIGLVSLLTVSTVLLTNRTNTAERT